MSATAVAEKLNAPQTISPTVNYLVNDGAEIFNYTGGPGSTEVKSGGTLDPHQVTMHNARPHLAEFKLDVQRKIVLIGPERIKAALGMDVPSGLKWVGFSSENTITASGEMCRLCP